MLVTASGDLNWVGLAHALKRRGVSVVTFLVNPASFGGGHDNAGLATALWGVGLPAYRVEKDMDLAASVLWRG